MIFEAPTEGALRQGDLCVIDAYPQWTLDAEIVSNSAGPTRIQTGVQSRGVEYQGGVLVAVCSQCCDLEKPGKTSGILVAPVRLPPINPSETDRAEAIRLSAIDDGEGHWSYVSLFPLMLNEPERLTVVDFSQIVALSDSKRAGPGLKARRVHQLSDALRDQFRQKLAIFVGRPPDE